MTYAKKLRRKNDMVNIRQNLVASGKYSIKCPYTMAKYTSVTLHNTGNDASAENEIKYMTTNNNKVSFHYAVDDKEIVQGIPDDRNAWHCGNTVGNRNSLSIEVCYSKSGGDRFTKAEQNAAEFVAYKLKQAGLGIANLTTHKAWSGKNCPSRTLELGWDRFVAMVNTHMGGSAPSSNDSQQNTSSSGNPNSSYTGSSVVDYLKSIGQESSLSARKKLAAQHGISPYTGTASQNSKLLAALRGSSTSSSSSSTSSTQTATGLPSLKNYKGTSIVDGLKSVGYDSGYASRKALAAKVGISGYTGTAAQNTALLKALR